MKLNDVVKHFGSKLAACKALGISKQAGTKWGYWMLRATASKIEDLTGGAVKFDYNEPDLVVDGVRYIPATDIESPHRIKRNLEQLYFYDGVNIIKAKDESREEVLRMFRKLPPYRKG